MHPPNVRDATLLGRGRHDAHILIVENATASSQCDFGPNDPRSILGTPGNDVLIGTSGADHISGTAGAT